VKTYKLREILNRHGSSCATRICTSWSTMFEAAASAEVFDDLELVAEYSPYDLMQLENITRACELHNTGSLIKVDFQNRGHVAQRAIASGFLGALFADHRNADAVAESVRMLIPETLKERNPWLSE